MTGTVGSFAEIIKSDKTVLVGFSTGCCGHGRAMFHILQELKSALGESVVILNIDVAKNPKAAFSYQINGVPTTLIFRNGMVKWRKTGLVRVNHLKMALNEVIESS